MAECTIKASIHLGGLQLIRLSPPLETELPNLQIKNLHLSSSSERELQIELKLEASSKAEAKALAGYRLNQIADMLSFKHDVAVEGVAIHTVEDKNRGEGELIELIRAEAKICKLEELDAGSRR